MQSVRPILTPERKSSENLRSLECNDFVKGETMDVQTAEVDQ